MTKMHDRTKRVLLTEKECGCRAAFHVLYRRSGKQYVDPVFPAQAQTIEGAAEFIRATARSLRWKIEVIEAYHVDQKVKLLAYD